MAGCSEKYIQGELKIEETIKKKGRTRLLENTYRVQSHESPEIA